MVKRDNCDRNISIDIIIDLHVNPFGWIKENIKEELDYLSIRKTNSLREGTQEDDHQSCKTTAEGHEDCFIPNGEKSLDVLIEGNAGEENEKVAERSMQNRTDSCAFRHIKCTYKGTQKILDLIMVVLTSQTFLKQSGKLAHDVKRFFLQETYRLCSFLFKWSVTVIYIAGSAIGTWLSWKTVLIWQLLGMVTVASGADVCKDKSVETMRVVKECPMDKKTWNEQAELMNCSGKVPAQCSDLKYHCVVNGIGNAFVEVCAEPQYIQKDSCPEFNKGGQTIQRRLDFKPSPPPGKVFNSRDVYRYPVCLRLEPSPETPNTLTTIPSTTNRSPGTPNTLTTIPSTTNRSPGTPNTLTTIPSTTNRSPGTPNTLTTIPSTTNRSPGTPNTPTTIPSTTNRLSTPSAINKSKLADDQDQSGDEVIYYGSWISAGVLAPFSIVAILIIIFGCIRGQENTGRAGALSGAERGMSNRGDDHAEMMPLNGHVEEKGGRHHVEENGGRHHVEENGSRYHVEENGGRHHEENELLIG